MPKPHLDALFRPSSIALISAGDDPVGAVLAASLASSAEAGFKGRLMAVSPERAEIAGLRAYAAVADLPEVPDLGLICAAPNTVPELIEQLGARGAPVAVVVGTGLRGHGGHGGEHAAAARAAADRHRLRLLGPRSVGVLTPGLGLNASLAPRLPAAGPLAFVAQSGSMLTAVVDWALPRGIGFSHLISLGDMADVGFGSVLDYLATDRATRGILLAIESVANTRRFMSAARAAARMKPIIVVKGGRFPEGARAVASHTGVLAGRDAVYDAAFRRAGLLRVGDLTELFDAAGVLAAARPPRGDRLLILSNGGGLAVLATDALTARGGRLAALAPEAVAALDALLPLGWPRANPVDLGIAATAGRYADVLAALAGAAGIDGILALHGPSGLASATDAAAAVIDHAPGPNGPLLLTGWVGGEAVTDARKRFAERHIPTYETPEQAVRAFMDLVHYGQNQRLLTETPPSIPEDYVPDANRVKALIDGLGAAELQRRGGWLTEVESKQVLSAYGIPTVPTRLAESPEAAARLAAEIGAPVALKAQSPALPHKTAVGAVELNLAGPAAVQQAAEMMRARLAAEQPQAPLLGFSVQPMVHRPGAYDLILGVADDPQFGPVMLVGHGGTRAEAIADQAIGLPPLNLHLAREMLSRTRIHRLLQGGDQPSDRPPAATDAVALALVRLSQLVCDTAAIRELDINPLLADAYGVVALDARIRVAPAETEADPGARLAIRPYPKELEETITLGDGRRLLLRPIRPEDELALQDAITKLTPEEIRLRFFAPIRTLDHIAAARFTQLDYDREMALVLTDPGGRGEIYGVVSLSADAYNEAGEYAVLVRHDMAGMGLGVLLMRRIIDYARGRGIGEIVADVLRENRTMLKLCQVLGFTTARDPDDIEIVKVRLRL